MNYAGWGGAATPPSIMQILLSGLGGGAHIYKGEDTHCDPPTEMFQKRQRVWITAC